jgi:signal transduction histidine kinase
VVPERPPVGPERPERRQTDDSLRVEREKTDEALTDDLSAVDETADAVLGLARRRADEIIARARAATDRGSTPGSAGAARALEAARGRADEALRVEREDAEEIVRVEREEHAKFLTLERDETDRDLSTERERSDRAVTVRDEFLGVVSHDLRNMLGVIVNSAALIAGAAGVDDEREAVLANARRIQRLSGRMSRLIGDLVDVASIDAGRLTVAREPGDPTHVAAEAVDTFTNEAAANGIALATYFAAPPCSVSFDAARILQVLVNLLGNALKFTPSGGSVTVRSERVGDEVRLSVSDTGLGIPADKLDSVFERFVQAHSNDRRGVGLGLFISKCIVEGHGGRIWVESTVGEGSTFTFTLPVSASP